MKICIDLNKKKGKEKKKREFSKTLLIQESVLIWIITLSFIALAFLCVYKGYVGSLPWLGAMVALPWTAYGVSQACYYNKSKAQNSKNGITYETAMRQLYCQQQNNINNCQNNTNQNYEPFDPFGPI